VLCVNAVPVTDH